MKRIFFLLALHGAIECAYAGYLYHLRHLVREKSPFLKDPRLAWEAQVPLTWPKLVVEKTDELGLQRQSISDSNGNLILSFDQRREEASQSYSAHHWLKDLAFMSKKKEGYDFEYIHLDNWKKSDYVFEIFHTPAKSWLRAYSKKEKMLHVFTRDPAGFFTSYGSRSIPSAQ